MQPAKLSGLLRRFTPALATLAIAWPLVGCGGEDSPEPASAPADPPLLQQQTESKPEQDTDIEDLGTQTPEPADTDTDTTDTQTPEPLVGMDPYRVLEEKIAELPNIHLAEVYFDLGADALERAEDTDDYTANRLVVWLVVEDSALQGPDPDGPGVIDVPPIPDTTRDSIMQMVTEAFPDADSVEIYIEQNSSGGLTVEAESTVLQTPIEADGASTDTVTP